MKFGHAIVTRIFEIMMKNTGECGPVDQGVEDRLSLATTLAIALLSSAVFSLAVIQTLNRGVAEQVKDNTVCTVVKAGGTEGLRSGQ